MTLFDANLLLWTLKESASLLSITWRTKVVKIFVTNTPWFLFKLNFAIYLVKAGLDQSNKVEIPDRLTKFDISHYSSSSLEGTTVKSPTSPIKSSLPQKPPSPTKRVPPAVPARHPSTTLSTGKGDNSTSPGDNSSTTSGQQKLVAPTNTKKIGKKIEIVLTKGIEMSLTSIIYLYILVCSVKNVFVRKDLWILEMRETCKESPQQ